MNPSQEFFEGLARYQAIQHTAFDLAHALVNHQALTLAKVKVSTHARVIEKIIKWECVNAANERLAEFLQKSGLMRLVCIGSDYAHVFYQAPRQSLVCPEAVVLVRYSDHRFGSRLILTLYGTEEQVDLLHHLISSHIEDHKLTVYTD